MYELILLEIIHAPAEPSRGRHHPRVVKRAISHFPTKARARPPPAGPQICRYSEHIRIVPPAAVDAPPPITAPQGASRSPKPTSTCAIWRQHVRAWKASRLTRRAYCQSHGLGLYRFNQWVARLRRRPPAQTSGETP